MTLLIIYGPNVNSWTIIDQDCCSNNGFIQTTQHGGTGEGATAPQHGGTTYVVRDGYMLQCFFTL